MPNNDPKKWTFFVSDILSTNIAETPDGFLVCKNVPVARTGEYLYSKDEVPVSAKNGVVKIRREDDVVFNDDTIKSFEGKPITIDHPEEFVSPENWKELSHGHLQNVRRGTGEQDDLLLGDLLITTAKAIELVKGGLRQISLGYDSDYEEIEEGLGRQKNIIGNHVALVDKGRAGNRCSIGDKMCDHCGQCKCKNKMEDGVMKNMKKGTFKTKVKDAFKKVLDALENELNSLTEEDDDKKKKEEALQDKTKDDKSFNRKIVKAFNKKAGLDAEGEMGTEGGEEGDPIAAIREKIEELNALLDQADGGTDDEGTPGGETETEDPDILQAQQKRKAEEKEGTETGEEEEVKDEGEGGDLMQEILARLDKLEQVIVELVKSDEEVHAAMDSIMNGDPDKKDDDDDKEEKESTDAEGTGIIPGGGQGSMILKQKMTSGASTGAPSMDGEETEEEKKKWEEEEEKKKGTMDSSVWTDLSYRAGILAPEMNIAKPDSRVPQVVETIKREALKRALTTDAECVAPFVKGKNINTLSGVALETAFVGASELMAKLNNERVQNRSLHKTFDAGSPIANQIRAINEGNKNFWKR